MARYRLTGRTVLITGATGGIGTATAHLLHGRGANLVLLGRDTSALSALARRLEEERVLPLTADVTDQAALDGAVARAVHRFGGLDVVFANAGVAPTRPATLATVESAVFEHIIEVNAGVRTDRHLSSAPALDRLRPGGRVLARMSAPGAPACFGFITSGPAARFPVAGAFAFPMIDEWRRTQGAFPPPCSGEAPDRPAQERRKEVVCI